MATHSSVLAWRIPGLGEPGGLPSMGSQSRTRLKRLSSSSSRGGSEEEWQTTEKEMFLQPHFVRALVRKEIILDTWKTLRGYT